MTDNMADSGWTRPTNATDNSQHSDGVVHDKPSVPSDTTSVVESLQLHHVTQEELDANRPFGWYVGLENEVYQTINIATNEVRHVGRLRTKATDDGSQQGSDGTPDPSVSYSQACNCNSPNKTCLIHGEQPSSSLTTYTGPAPSDTTEIDKHGYIGKLEGVTLIPDELDDIIGVLLQDWDNDETGDSTSRIIEEAKAKLLEWCRKETLRVIGDDEPNDTEFVRNNGIKLKNTSSPRNNLRAEQRAELQSPQEKSNANL